MGASGDTLAARLLEVQRLPGHERRIPVIPLGFPGSIFSGGEDNHQNYLRGALSHVTGSHAAKVGFTFHNGARANTVYQCTAMIPSLSCSMAFRSRST